MSAGYRFVLEERAFETFIKLNDDDRALAHSYFRWLTKHPHAVGAGSVTDTAGRINYGSLCGPFFIVHWTDHAAREIRIVQFNLD